MPEGACADPHRPLLEPQGPGDTLNDSVRREIVCRPPAWKGVGQTADHNSIDVRVPGQIEVCDRSEAPGGYQNQRQVNRVVLAGSVRLNGEGSKGLQRVRGAMPVRVQRLDAQLAVGDDVVPRARLASPDGDQHQRDHDSEQ